MNSGELGKGRKTRGGLWLLCVAGLLVLCGCGEKPEPVETTPVVIGRDIILDPNLNEYLPEKALNGSITVAGSDTLAKIMKSWANAFKAYHPDVLIVVEGDGSSTAPPALISGAAQVGQMSRKMRMQEMMAFGDTYGYAPTEVWVAGDAAAVLVHRDNPIVGMSIPQVDAVFSITRNRGAKDVRTWGDLGLGGDWANKPITLYGRNAASGTYQFFTHDVFLDGEFKPAINELPGSREVVQAVSNDLSGIGYVGVSYLTDEVHVVPLSNWKEDGYYEPTHDNCLNKNYELFRFLRNYLNKKPGTPIDPVLLEFYRFVFSIQGQSIVKEQGYFPLNAAVAEENFAKLLR